MNAQYVGYEYNYTYLIFCGFICLAHYPGIGLPVRWAHTQEVGLTMLFQSLMVGAVTTFQVDVLGATLWLTAGPLSPFIGDLANFGMKNVMAAPSIGNSTIRRLCSACTSCCSGMSDACENIRWWM